MRPVSYTHLDVYKRQVCALLDCGVAKKVEEILEKMVYIQFAAVEDFLNTMVAAQALPHTCLLYTSIPSRK